MKIPNTQSVAKFQATTNQGAEIAGNKIDPDTLPDVIQKSFQEGQRQWIAEPVIERWASSPPPTLREANELYHQWKENKPGPFYPFSDELWWQTAQIMSEAGLPWYNNNLNRPEEIDPSWPFHTKEFERLAVTAKGDRVGDKTASGYICSWDEANQYGIRALQQELRIRAPDKKPLLVGSCIEDAILCSAAQMLGLEYVDLGDEWKQAETTIDSRMNGEDRPIIFAATLGSTEGKVDDFEKISLLLQKFPGLLHVDASRSFDYVTTLPMAERQKLGIPHLILDPRMGSSQRKNGNIHAATIVAGGMNSIFPPPVVVLKPVALGQGPMYLVEYVRGTDSTISGSRDGLGPLLVYMQELRFGVAGIRDIYNCCARNRRVLYEMLMQHDIQANTILTSLDMIIFPKRILSESISQRWGLQMLENGSYLLTVQPSITAEHISGLVHAISAVQVDVPPLVMSVSSNYPIPQEIIPKLRKMVMQWKKAGRISAGCPANQAPYSALGPVTGHFLSIRIPEQWATQKTEQIFKERKRALGLLDVEHAMYSGSFTTGSTMGNRIGLHTALAQHPDAFVYYSSATHYSVKKAVRDNDILTGRWCLDKRPRFAEIPEDHLGRMNPEDLAKQVFRDRAYCQSRGKRHEVILMVNLGTTFVGGWDDILALREGLRGIGADTAHIHADGALDLGFSMDGVRLGPPDMVSRDGMPVVQGITLSHHKVLGIMVSGEVICFNPLKQRPATTVTAVDPRIVFETWLICSMYSPTDLLQIRGYCLQNSQLLRKLLQSHGVNVKFNSDSIITLLERPPPWIMEEFHLAPEGEWAHYITMPHISPRTIGHFVQAIALFDIQFKKALAYIRPALQSILGEKVKAARICCGDSTLLPLVLKLAQDCQPGFSTHTFKRLYLHGGVSFVALDTDGQPLAIFLAQAMTSRRIYPGPVLTRSKDLRTLLALSSISSMFFLYLSQLLDSDSLEETFHTL
ncbi:hypothetical protein FQN49_006081 [Arthroderma sp. PD_2]|nr:hypothetical protein FQN49_006081 [Arthroderma sp. PD_2]